jgi:hypothetical protein
MARGTRYRHKRQDECAADAKVVGKSGGDVDSTKVERLAMTGDCYVYPPVPLVVPMKKIPGRAHHPDHPERKMTPPRPRPGE